jgi:hypothetical protein
MDRKKGGKWVRKILGECPSSWNGKLENINEFNYNRERKSDLREREKKD